MFTGVKPPTLDVLAVLEAAPGHETHGYDLIKQTGRVSATVYKILERLAGQGVVTERWESLEDTLAGYPRRPRRRYYKLTDSGLQYAREVLVQHRPRRSR